MEALKAFEFGHLIAFILPGLVATRAVSYFLPLVGTAMQKVAEGGEGAFGPLIFLFLLAATVGLAISVVRQQWLDPAFGLICYRTRLRGSRILKKCRLRPNERPGGTWRPSYERIRSDDKMAALYQGAVANVYRYYQFITNLAIATALLVVGRALKLDGAAEANITYVFAGMSVLFLLTGYLQFVGWCRVHNQITGEGNQTGAAQA